MLARAVQEKDIFEIHPVECPLDVLAQVILAMTIAERWHIDGLFDILRASSPYRHLSRTTFDAVFAMLAGRYADSKVRELRGRVHLDLPQPENGENPDLIRAQELNKDRARQLLTRYGIIFRDLLAKESSHLQWRSIYKTLRRMELSGEILAGYFFEGLEGPQFLTPETFRKLQKVFDHDAIFWLNACDPPSLCGIGPDRLRRNLPKKLATTYLVYHGKKIALTLQKNSREMEFFIPPDHPLIPRYLEVCKVLLTRDFNPLKALGVDSINGASPSRSAYLGNMRAYGFTTSHRGLILHKQR